MCMGPDIPIISSTNLWEAFPQISTNAICDHTMEMFQEAHGWATLISYSIFLIIIYSESTNTFYIEVFNVSNRKIKSKDFCYDPLEMVLCTNRKTHFNSETDHKCFKWQVNYFFVEYRPKRQRRCLCCLAKFITANWILCWLKKQCIWLDDWMEPQPLWVWLRS